MTHIKTFTECGIHYPAYQNWSKEMQADADLKALPVERQAEKFIEENPAVIPISISVTTNLKGGFQRSIESTPVLYLMYKLQ